MKTRIVIVALMAAMLLLVAAAPASAASVEPELYKGNPKLCEGGLKIDPPPASGTVVSVPWMVGSTPVTVTVSVYETAMGQAFDFSSTYPITRAVAKGGSQGAYLYDYDPAVTDDTLLHTPVTGKSGMWADLSWIGFCFGETEDGDNGDVEAKAVLSGAKFYDRDMDGVWDLDEPPLEGWLITLVGDDYTESMLTNSIGEYSFIDLPAGTYTITEAAPPHGSCWHQTAPAGGSHTVEVSEGQNVPGLDFGNVCMVYTTHGKTLGFWSNKNGQAVLSVNPGWAGMLRSYNLVVESGASFDPTTYAQLRSFLLNARAVNMSNMLSAQMSATLLNEHYGGQSFDGLGIVVDGSWKPIADVITEANAFLGANPVTRDGSMHRAEAEWYKCVFDGLNNNVRMVIPVDPCPVPVW